MLRSVLLPLALALLLASAGAAQAVGVALDVPSSDPRTEVCHKGLKDTACSLVAGIPLLGGTLSLVLHTAAAFACQQLAPFKELHYEACS